MPTSAVPAAINALLDILAGPAAAAKVDLRDGPPTVNIDNGDLLFIGYTPDTDIAASTQQAFASAGARRRDETAQIACYAESRSGSDNMRDRRTRVYEIAALVENALRATDDHPDAPTLNGAVLWAHLITGDLRQLQGGESCTAGLTILIAYQARI
jgi:hypothetical protein